MQQLETNREYINKYKMACQNSETELEFINLFHTLMHSQSQSQRLAERGVVLTSIDVASLERQEEGQGYPCTWRNPKTNEFYREYRVPIVRKEYLEQDISLYRWRMDQSPNLIKVHYLEIISDDAQGRHFRVFVDKTEPITGFTSLLCFRDGINLITDCLNGFKNIFQKLGITKITDKMIFLDGRKRGKVWINEEIGRNEFEMDFFGNQSTMIQAIFQIVQSKIEPHQLMDKLRVSIQKSQDFDEAIKAVHKLVEETRYSKYNMSVSDRSERKYFQRTPESRIESKTAKEIKDSNKEIPTKHRASIVCLPLTRPVGLEFRQRSKKPQSTRRKGPLNLKKHESHNPSSQRLDTNSNDPLTKNLSNKYLMFSSKTPKSSTKHVNYFATTQTSNVKSSKHHNTTSKESYSSRDISFRSTSKNHDNPQPNFCNTLRPSNMVRQHNRKRTGSTSHRSPSPLFLQLPQAIESLRRAEVSSQITKSMAVIKNQLEVLSTLKFIDHTKQSTKDFDFCSSRTVGDDTLLSSQKYPRTLEFHNIKKIDSSFISGGNNEEAKLTHLIGQLKHSVFNRMDDLKQSEIIIEDNQEQSLIDSRVSIVEDFGEHIHLQFNPKKHLRKMVSKPMVQSITINAIASEKNPENKLPRPKEGGFLRSDEQNWHSESPFAHLWRFRSIQESTGQSQTHS